MAELSQIPSTPNQVTDAPTSQTLGAFGAKPAWIPFAPAVPTPSTGPTMGPGPVGAPVSVTQTKKEEVAKASAAKNALFGNTSELRRLGTAVANGNNLGQEQLAQDVASGEAGLIANRYGMETLERAPDFWELQRQDAFDLAESRSNGEIAADSVLGVAAGAVGTLGGIGALSAGLVSPEAGSTVAGAVNSVTEGIRGAQSEALGTQRKFGSIRAQLDQEDSTAQYQKDVASGKDYAGLRRFGRDVLSSSADLAANPALAGDLVAEGIGSLAAVGVSAGLGVGTKGMPLVIGLLEAGGSYSDVQSQVQGMSEADLFAGSPEYGAMRANGMSATEARDKIANLAGIQAAAIAGPIGAASGKLVAGFESNLFGQSAGKGFVGSLRELGKNSLKEGTEEAIQGGLAPLAANIGIKSYADDQRDIQEGMGQGAVQGAVGGIGSAVPTNLPGIAGAAVSDTAKGLATIGNGMVAAGKARLASVEATNDETNAVGKTAVKQAVSTVASGLAGIKTRLEEYRATQAAAKAGEDPGNTTDTPESDTAQSDLEARVGALQIAPAAIFKAITQIESGALTPEQLAATSLSLREHAKKVEDLVNGDLTGLPEDAKKGIEVTRKALNVFLSSATVTDALAKADAMSSADLGDLGSIEITPETASTPVVAEAVQNTVMLAGANPAGIDVRFAKQALAQSGPLGLNQGAQDKLKAAVFLAEQGSKNKVAQDKLVAETTEKLTAEGVPVKVQAAFDMVTNELKEKGAKDKYAQLSLTRHQADITRAMDSGNAKEANRLLSNLGAFAEHKQGRYEAALKSAAMKKTSGNAVKHRTWTGQKWLAASEKGASDVFVPYTTTGQQFLKTVGMEADLVADVFNNLVEIYGSRPGITASKLAKVEKPKPVVKKDNGNTDEDFQVIERWSDNASADTGANQNQGSQSKPDSEGKPPSSEDQTNTPPTQSQTPSGNAGAGSAGSTPGTPTDAGGAGSGSEAGVDPKLVKAEKAAFRKKLATLRKDIRDTKRERRALIKEQKALYNLYTKSKRPLTALLIKTRKIDPKGKIGRELIAKDVTPKTSPGLFKVGGATDLDNLPLEDFAAAYPGIIEATGADRADTYLPEDGLVQLIIEEAGGQTNWLESRQDAKSLDGDIAIAEDTLADLEDELEAYGLPKPKERARAGTRSKADETTNLPGSAQGDQQGADGSEVLEGGEGQDAAGAEGPQIGSFENLATRPDGLSRFNRAFKIDTTKSKLMSTMAPARYVLELLANFANRKDELGLDYHVDEGQVQGWRRLIRHEGWYITEALNARLRAPSSDLRDMSPIASMEQTLRGEVSEKVTQKGEISKISDWLSNKSAMGLNLVDPAIQAYDPRLVQSAMLAALHWFMTTPKVQNLSDAEVAGFFKDMDVSMVTEDMRKLVNSGIGTTQAKSSLGKMIIQFWGAEINEKAPMSDVIGMSEHLAGELLEVMFGAKGRLGTMEKFQTTDTEGNPRDHVVLKLSNDETAEAVSELRGSKGLIGEGFVEGVGRTFHFGVIPENKRQTQKGNALSKLGETMKKALGVQRQIVRKRNTTQLDLMRAMGQDAWRELKGYVPVELERMNGVHRVSVEGLNNSIDYSWEGVMAFDAQLELYVLKQNEGKDPSEHISADDVEVFYDYNAASNERQMAAGFSGQADKDMREVAVATRSKLNLLDEKDNEGFWLTVGQSTGLVKTELDQRPLRFQQGKARAVNASLAQDLIRRTYPQSLAILKDWVTDTKGALAPEERATIINEVARKTNQKSVDKIMHALTSVARYDALFEDVEGNKEFLESFTHDLSLEADGKTDGPMNLILHFTTGEFDALTLGHMARGGFFPGVHGMTLNKQFGKDPVDMYQYGTNLFNSLFIKRKGMLSQTAETAAMMAAIERVLGALGDVKIDPVTGVLQITRNGIKNNFTIKGYGSGDAGIAGKVTSLMLDVLYERMTALEQEKILNPSAKLALVMPGHIDTEQLRKDLDLLTNRRLIRVKSKEEGKEATWFTDKKTKRGQTPPALMDMENGRQFKLSPEQFQMLQENIQHGFVKPMVDSITQVFGNAQQTVEMFQHATQAMSLVLMDRFESTVKEQLAAKRASGELEKGEFLSSKDYEDIFTKLAKYGAIIEPVASDENSLNLSIKEGQTSEYEFSRGFGGEFSGKAQMMAPRQAGVSGSPMITISRGDARMMVNFYAAADAKEAGVLRTEPVYDGLEMPADLIEVLSQRINKAVSDAWLENPAQDVSDSFADWLRQGANGPFEGISVDTREKLEALFKRVNKSLFPKSDTGLGIALGSRQLADKLANDARSIQARKNVYARIGYSVDHMASGEEPYNHPGELWDGKGTLDGWLNQMYQEELAKLPEVNAKRRNPRPAVEPRQAALKARIAQYGQRLTNEGSTSGMIRMDAKTMIAVLDSDLVPAMHKPVIKALGKILPKFTFMLGEAKDLTEWRQNRYKLEGQPPIELGLTDFDSGIIYITNFSSETIVHELLHAVMGKVLTDHYLGLPTSPVAATAEVQKSAIGNLEKLMTQFMDMDFSKEDKGTAEAAQRAQQAVSDWAGEDLGVFSETPDPEDFMQITRKFSALSEFISWTLANQNLKDVLSTSKVKSRLTKIREYTMKVLRRLLGLSVEARMDVFSNIQSNAAALMFTIRKDADQKMRDGISAGLRLAQVDPNATRNSRMRDVREKFEAKIGAHLRAKAVKEPGYSMAEDFSTQTVAYVALNRFKKAGFHFDLEQASTFKTIQAAMASSMEIAPGAMAQTQKIFQHLIKGLTVESLMKDVTDDIERTDASNKFDAIVGKDGTERDPQGRSNLMASVMALSVVDEDFRKVLENVSLPEDRKISYDSADDFLNSLGESVMNTLGTAISEEGRGANRNTRQALDKLVQVLARIEKDDRTFIEKGTQGYLDKAEDFGVTQVQKLGSKLASFSDSTKNSTSKAKVILGGGAEALAALINKDRGAAYNTMLTGAANTTTSLFVPKVLKEVLAEVIGMDDTNKGVYALTNPVKAEVSALRQANREELPKIFAKQFKNKLADTAWHAMHVVFARTDIAALGSFTRAELHEVIGDATKLDAQTSKMRDAIQAEAKFLGSVGVRTMLRKADELAEFMVTGKVPQNLLKNGYAIAKMLGESGQKAVARNGGPSDALVEALESYVSLRALALSKTAKPAEWSTVVDLVADETAGIDFLMATLVDLRNKELDRLTTNASRENAWKGYIPEEVPEGALLIVADDRQHNQLLSLGYTKEGAYEGSGYEAGSRSYYLSNVGGNSAYIQGIMQTIQMTAMGTDPATGANTSGITAGAVRGPKVGSIERMIANKGGNPNLTGEPLIAIYSDGDVVAYERSMKPEMRALLNRNTHLGEMMGAWAGRQLEEQLAQTHNETLIDELKKNWDAGKKEGITNQYTNVSDEEQLDKIFGNSWEMIPRATKEYIRNTFANDPGFMIRNDMINNALGYRMPSVKDAWTGMSRMSGGVQKAIKDSATILMGNNAVPWLVTAEKAWQAGIATAKHLIVVKSVIVPMSNEASNTVQLMTRGVPIRQILKGKTGKLVEITQYLKNRDKEIEIDAQLARFHDDRLMTSKLLAQKKNLDDSNRSMSIWPLLEAGEFSTISDGQTEVDAALQTGKWIEYAQNLMDRLPAKLGTVGRYAMVTRDTALFQGMSRAVAYSDFLAKAVLYDHLTKTKKVGHKDAIAKVSSEFVNYNFVAGRTRSYAESMGITWFWAYKLRSVGTALSTLRENPLRALLTTYGAQFAPDLPGVSVGSPVTDNAVAVIGGGRSSYSLGLDMLWTAPGLNPWLNAIDNM